MSSRKIILVGLVISITFLCIYMITNTTNNSSEQIINTSSSGPNEIILEIDDYKITIQDFNNAKLLYNLDKNSDVENTLIKNYIIKELALEDGIIPSEKEVEDYIDIIKDLTKNNSSAKQSFDKFLVRTGQTAKEYWSNLENFNRYKDAYIIGKYVQSVSEKLLRKHPDIDTEELNALAAEEIDKITNKQKEKLDIKRYY